MSKVIIIAGTPVDGFTYYGPYNSADEAIDAAENPNHGISTSVCEWWIAELQTIPTCNCGATWRDPDCIPCKTLEILKTPSIETFQPCPYGCGRQGYDCNH